MEEEGDGAVEGVVVREGRAAVEVRREMRVLESEESAEVEEFVAAEEVELESLESNGSILDKVSCTESESSQAAQKSTEKRENKK